MIHSALSMLLRSKPSRLLLIRRRDALAKRPERRRRHRLQQIWEKKRIWCDTCPSNVGFKSLARRRAAREEQCDGPRVNQQSYSGPITIRRALISHNAPFFLPRAEHGWPRSDGLHVAEKGRSRLDRLSRFLNKFLNGFRRVEASLSVRPICLLCDKNLIRTCGKMRLSRFSVMVINLSLSARDQRRTWPHSHLLSCPLGNKTAPFSEKCPYVVIAACRHFWQ